MKQGCNGGKSVGKKVHYVVLTTDRLEFLSYFHNSALDSVDLLLGGAFLLGVLLEPYNVPFWPHFLLSLHLVSLTFKLTLPPYPNFPKVYNSLFFTIFLIRFAYNFTLLSYLTIDQKCISAKTV